MEPSRHTYEMHGDEWQEVGPQPATRRRSLLRGVGAFLVTAFLMAGIAAIGVVAACIALVLSPVALLAVWFLKALPVQPMDTRSSR
jgi:hypothetical protein